jgi:N-acetylglucosamine-6-phosphate deacetylase
MTFQISFWLSGHRAVQSKIFQAILCKGGLKVSAYVAKKKLFMNADIYHGGGVTEFGYLEVVDGVISAIGHSRDILSRSYDEVVDLKSLNLSSGWLDLQVNGCGSMLFEDVSSEDDVRLIGDALAEQGVTQWFGALVSVPDEKLERIESLLQRCIGRYGLRGLHVEGPWLNHKFKGCHPVERLRTRSAKHIDFIRRVSKYCPVMVTLSPEVADPQDMQSIRGLESVVIFAGHTDCSWVDGDVRNVAGVTHIMNAMPGISARNAGAVGWLIMKQSRRASIICDGNHVCAQSIAILKRATYPSQLFLVSDMMPTDTPFTKRVSFLRGAEVASDGALRSADGTLAGSASSLRRGLKYLVQHVGIPISDALKMVTEIPAGVVSLSCCNLVVGASADFVAFDNQIDIQRVVRNGEVVV